MKNLSIMIHIFRINLFLFLIAIVIGCQEENLSPENLPPSISILNPSSDQKIPYNQDLTISVDANDPDGPLSEVKLFVNNVEVGSKSSKPYSFEFRAGEFEIGEVLVRAVAIRSEGSTAEASSSFEIIALDPSIVP